MKYMPEDEFLKYIYSALVEAKNVIELQNQGKCLESILYATYLCEKRMETVGCEDEKDE